jgi:hypothetical protein
VRGEWDVGHSDAVIRRLVILAVVVAALWLAAMVVTGWGLEARTRERIAERIADSLQGEATIPRGDLAMVRGWIDLEDLAVKRDDVIGHLAITVDHVRCELPPLGLALFDRDCRDLVVRDIRFEMSSAALFQGKRPKRPPMRAERVVIEKARLELSASAIVPSLGRVVVDVARAEAGPTVFKTPLSWLFSLRALDATVALPGDVALTLSYAGGELRVAGGAFGSAPIALPVSLPVADAADDARAEIAKLVGWGREVGQQLIVRKAGDWLRSKLAPAAAADQPR